MTDAIIVDIDGTLSDPSHRLHYIRNKPKRWDLFLAGALEDKVNEDIRWLVLALYNDGFDIIIATAREEGNRELTEKWLNEVAGLEGTYKKVYMRPDKDFRSDFDIKTEMLDQIKADGYNPVMAIDDRNSAVAAWRKAGIRTLQVAEGNY
jgi:phosphoglycolate phosphatase-like HAD superfamily hydrolase